MNIDCNLTKHQKENSYAKVTLVPGDGIGPEITGVVKQVLAAAGAKLEWEEMEIGTFWLMRKQVSLCLILLLKGME